MPFGVDPQTVVGDSIPLLAAIIKRLQMSKDLRESDGVRLAALLNDWDTTPVQQLVDGNADRLVTANPTSWFPDLDVVGH